MAAKKKTKAKKKPVARKKAPAKKHTSAKAVHHSPSSGHAASHHESSVSMHWQKAKYTSLKEFWPFYLNEHAHKSNRTLHFIGSSLGLIILAVALISAKYILIVPALVSGYAFAWFGHFFIEKNRPATFTYPLKSFISDWRMWYCTFMDKTEAEMQRFGIRSK